jgi:hypothetical protein
LGTIVLEGLGRQLDPNLKFVEAAIPFLWRNAPNLTYLLQVIEVGQILCNAAPEIIFGVPQG